MNLNIQKNSGVKRADGKQIKKRWIPPGLSWDGCLGGTQRKVDEFHVCVGPSREKMQTVELAPKRDVSTARAGFCNWGWTWTWVYKISRISESGAIMRTLTDLGRRSSKFSLNLRSCRHVNLSLWVLETWEALTSFQQVSSCGIFLRHRVTKEDKSKKTDKHTKPTASPGVVNNRFWTLKTYLVVPALSWCQTWAGTDLHMTVPDAHLCPQASPEQRGGNGA